jgi:hypothetical protein
MTGENSPSNTLVVDHRRLPRRKRLFRIVRTALGLSVLLVFCLLSIATSPSRSRVRTEGNVWGHRPITKETDKTYWYGANQTVMRIDRDHGPAFAKIDDVTLTDSLGRFVFPERENSSGEWLVAHVPGRGVGVARLVGSQKREGFFSLQLFTGDDHVIQKESLELLHRGLADSVSCECGTCTANAPKDAWGALIAVQAGAPDLAYAASITALAPLPSDFVGEVFALYDAHGAPFTVTTPLFVSAHESALHCRDVDGDSATTDAAHEH